MPNWLKGAIIGGVVGFVYNLSLFFLSITNSGREFLTGMLGLFFKPITIFINFWCNTFVFPKSVGGQFNCNILTPELIFILLLIIIGAIIGFMIAKK